mgnify:FL=1
MKTIHRRKSYEKRYVVYLFGCYGDYCGKIEFHRFLPAWLYMWMNNDLYSTATMVDKETKKEYSW